MNSNDSNAILRIYLGFNLIFVRRFLMKIKKVFLKLTHALKKDHQLESLPISTLVS
jgi:hypothetical protein